MILGTVGSILIIGIAVFISKRARNTAKKLKEEDEAEKLKLLQTEEESKIHVEENSPYSNSLAVN